MSVRTNTATGRLSGKVAVVTGAGAGIGEATAIAMARKGAGVVPAIVDRAGEPPTRASSGAPCP